MGGTVAALATIVVAAFAFGHGILTLAGAREWTWTAPAVGLALAVALASIGVRIAGEAKAVAVVFAALTVASAVLLLNKRHFARAAPSEGALVLVLAIAATLIPFVVNGRFGLLGVSFNNDASRHLIAIEYLRISGHVPGNLFGLAYPSGPHALVAVVAAGTGARADQALDGFLMSVPIFTALTALAAFGRAATWRGVVAAVLTGLAYLPAAYFISAAFKETAMALWVLTFAVTLHRASAPTAATSVVLAILVCACAQTYSYAGLVWPILTLVLFAAVTLVQADRGARYRAGVDAIRSSAAAAGLLVVLLAPSVSSWLSLFRSVGISPAATGAIGKQDVGYTVGQLSPFEALGVWPSGDFRLAPSAAAAEWLASLVGAAAVVYGLGWALRRRELALPTAFAALGVSYAWLRHTESPWVSAKALVILAPVAALVAARGALAPAARPWRTVLAAIFVPAALGSSLLTLRTAQVEPPSHRDELARLVRLLGSQRVLLLTTDDYGAWRLFPAGVAQLGLVTRPEKRYQEGDPYDFDSPFPQTLASYSYVITTRAHYASAAPGDFRMVRQTASYVLWRRERAAPPRGTLVEGPAPGAKLDCDSAVGRNLLRQNGEALVRPPPVEAALPSTLRGGAAVATTLALSRGRWDLSLQYQSGRELKLRAEGTDLVVPPSLDRVGSYWPAGTLRVGGSTAAAVPVHVTLALEDAPVALLRRPLARLGRLAATPANTRLNLLPLRHACGHYLDWYTIGP